MDYIQYKIPQNALHVLCVVMSGVFRIYFKKGGPNVRWPLVLTQRGPNQVFQFFTMSKKKLLAYGGPWPIWSGVNTPLVVMPDDAIESVATDAA